MRRNFFSLALILSIVLLAGSEHSKAADLNFYVDVYAWFPGGEVKKASPGDGIYFQGNIHPDGTRLVYSGNSAGPVRVWTTDLKSGKIMALTPEDSGAHHPVYSWDGKRIAFTSDRNHGQPLTAETVKATGLPSKEYRANIFVMDADGTNLGQITKGDYFDQRPTFSPDGKYMAFVRTIDQKWHILVVPVDGSAEPRDLSIGAGGYRPWFSADGKTIYFHSRLNKRDQIVKIPLEGGEVVPLANDNEGNSRGVFADSNGKALLMHSTRSGDWGIWELPLDGSKPRQLIPPGYERALHASRSRNGVVGFDAYRRSIGEDSLITSSASAGAYRHTGAPVFTVKFPDKFREKSPNTKFDQVYSVTLPSGFNVQIVVSGIPNGQPLKEAGSAYAHGIIARYFNTEVEIVSNEERELSDGTKAYLTAFQWEARSGNEMTSYILTAYKENKLVQVNGHVWGEPAEILKILNSLTFKRP